MVITRNGVNITLTPEELETAFLEKQHDKDVERMYAELSKSDAVSNADEKIDLAEELACQYRTAFDDDQNVRKVSDAIAKKLVHTNDTYNVSLAVDGRINVEVQAKSFKEAFQKAVLHAGDADWNTLECISINPVNAERESDREFQDYL